MLLLAYIGAHILLTIAVRALEHALGANVDPALAPSWYPAYNLGRQFVCAAIIAAVQAVLFARLGKAIDRPLWKCTGDAEALRRFFTLWFVINLIGVTMEQCAINAQNSGDEALQGLVALLYIPAYLLLPLLAACIMYFGKLDWANLLEALAPFGRQLRLAAGALLVMLFCLVANDAGAIALRNILGDDGLDRAVVLPALVIALPAALECLAFTVMWRVCMADRDSHYYEDPYDF